MIPIVIKSNEHSLDLMVDINNVDLLSQQKEIIAFKEIMQIKSSLKTINTDKENKKRL